MTRPKLLSGPCFHGLVVNSILGTAIQSSLINEEASQKVLSYMQLPEGQVRPWKPMTGLQCVQASIRMQPDNCIFTESETYSI